MIEKVILGLLIVLICVFSSFSVEIAVILDEDFMQNPLRFGCKYFICINLIKFYMVNGLIGIAQKLFDEMPERDLVSWNLLIACYSQAGLHYEALNVESDENVKYRL